MTADMLPVPSLSGFATPIAYPNLVAWYKASDFDSELDGSEVVSWQNSGYSPLTPPLFLTAAGAVGNRATVARNSINSTMTSVACNGKRGLKSNVSTAILSSKTTWTWFAVVKFTSRAAENDCGSLFVTGNVTELRFGIDSSARFLLTYGNVAAYPSTGMLSLNDWHYIICEESAGTATFYIDGSASLTWNSTPGVGGPTNVGTDVWVCDGNGSQVFTGSLAETGVYDRAITAAERSGLFTYFQTLYGLT